MSGEAESDPTLDRTVVDDGTTASLSENLLNLVLHAKPDAFGIGCHHSVKVILVKICKLAARSGYAGIIERDVQFPELLNSCCYRTTYLGSYGNVCLYKRRFASLRLN